MNFHIDFGPFMIMAFMVSILAGAVVDAYSKYALAGLFVSVGGIALAYILWYTGEYK